MAKIKMRINNNRESVCFNCGREWKDVREMYDLKIGYKKERTLPLCQKCIDEMEKKFLKASCMYNAKVKDKVAMKRIQNERTLDLEESGKKFMKLNDALKGMGVRDENN